MSDYTDAIKDAYSFTRPAYIVGQALIRGMIKGGLTEAQAISLIYSKAYRWQLDGSLGQALENLGEYHGEKMARIYEGHEWTTYDLPQHAQLEGERA